jgi:prevent-host-death family protein
MQVNIHEAKTNLSRLLEAVESGKEAEVIIARNGKPVGRLTAATPQARKIRWGVAKGLFVVPDNIDRDNEEIARLFYGDLD